MNIALSGTLLSLSASAGNVIGYGIGRAIGSPLSRRDGRLIKRKHFDQTSAFFAKHGAKALALGRSVPIVRRFLTWSAVGALTGRWASPSWGTRWAASRS